MKKIVLFIIGLLAVFSILRVNSEEVSRSQFIVHPGYMELSGGSSDIKVAFGFLNSRGKKEQRWNLFPIYISLQSGKNNIRLSMSGLSFLKRNGVNIGKIIRIKGVYRNDIVSIGGNVIVSGKVEGDIWTLGADIMVKKGAVVTGSTVALGGKIVAEKGARIGGNKQSVPNLKIPFLYFLTGKKSARNFRLLIEFFRILLFILISFLVLLLLRGSVTGTVVVLQDNWKNILLFVVLSVFALPVIVILLSLSIVGIFFIPVFFLAAAVVMFFGFIAFTVRLGMWVRGTAKQNLGFLFGSCLIGYLFFEVPFLLGLILSYSEKSPFLMTMGSVLKITAVCLFTAGFLYSLGGELEYLRTKNGL